MKTGILLSGGVDSIALAYWKRPDVAYTIDYGQKSFAGELRAASAVAKELSLQHETIIVDCRSLGSGDLAGNDPCSIAPVPEWWPFRNQLLVTLAVMKAIQDGVGSLMVGSVRTDSSHLDGTEEFYGKLNDLVAFQEGQIAVEAPAIELTSVDLVRQSGIPASVLGWAHSCHTAGHACGLCRGCNKHREVMVELGYESY